MQPREKISALWGVWAGKSRRVPIELRLKGFGSSLKGDDGVMNAVGVMGGEGKAEAGGESSEGVSNAGREFVRTGKCRWRLKL